MSSWTEPIYILCEHNAKFPVKITDHASACSTLPGRAIQPAMHGENLAARILVLVRVRHTKRTVQVR